MVYDNWSVFPGTVLTNGFWQISGRNNQQLLFLCLLVQSAPLSPDL